MDNDDVEERLATLEAGLSRQRRDTDAALDRLAAELRQLRERVEVQIEALDRRLTRVERRP